jgi:DNA polymerase
VTELSLDIETYSSVDLKRFGVYAYTRSPDFKILMCGWGLDDDPIQVVTSQWDIYNIPGLWDDDVLKVAHNAPFERICFSEMARRQLDLEPYEYLPPDTWHDTAAISALKGYPRKLESVAKALGGELKDSAGTRLINLFCKPQRAFNYQRAYTPEEKPKEWAEFIDYCRQDVVTHRDVHRKLGGWPEDGRERRIFMVDQYINDRGIKLNVDLAKRGFEARTKNNEIAGKEIIDLTGANTPNSLAHIKKWLTAKGTTLPDMTADTIEATLKRKGLDPEVRRVLVLRQELGLTAPQKYEVALGSVLPDGRVRGQFMYHGAHTGRWTSRGIQLHNLPRYSFKSDLEDEEAARKEVQLKTVMAQLDLLLGLGASTDDLKKLVRSALVGPFTIVDYSAIEARVLAWLAGEEWVLQAFRDGKDLYVVQADKMSTPTKKMERRDGKIAVLALGYQGAIGSLQAMGAEGGKDELLPLVLAYRKSVPRIVEFWQEMNDAFRRGGTVGAGFISIEKTGPKGVDRTIHLPSGRDIVYHGFKMITKIDKNGVAKVVPSFMDPRTGFRSGTYGGRLTENVTQAVARDVMADAIVRLYDAGYQPVAHVHDEVVNEGNDLPGIKEIMTQVPDWAPGLPIDGEGFVAPFYIKG